MSHKSLTEKLARNVLSLDSIVDEMDTTLEASFLDMSKTTATAKHLRLYDTAACHAAGHLLRFFRAESHLAYRDGDLVRAEKSTGLVLVELQAAKGQRTVTEQGSVKTEALGEHHFVYI